MANPRLAVRMRLLKLSIVALLQSLKYRFFLGKLNKTLEKVQILVLNMRIFPKFDPRTHLGCPWLVKINQNFKFIQIFQILNLN